MFEQNRLLKVVSYLHLANKSCYQGPLQSNQDIRSDNDVAHLLNRLSPKEKRVQESCGEGNEIINQEFKETDKFHKQDTSNYLGFEKESENDQTTMGIGDEDSDMDVVEETPIHNQGLGKHQYIVFMVDTK